MSAAEVVSVLVRRDPALRMTVNVEGINLEKGSAVNEHVVRSSQGSLGVVVGRSFFC